MRNLVLGFQNWIPASAGMTGWGRGATDLSFGRSVYDSEDCSLLDRGLL